MNEPRILVVSNNPFSFTSNNGKTLFSFFNDTGFELLQIYFSEEAPNIEGNYLQVNEKLILKGLLNRNSPWQFYHNKEHNIYAEKTINKQSKWKNKFKTSRLVREMREYIWKIKEIKDDFFIKKVQQFNPNIIFFCAGDTLFSYQIVEKLLNITSAKLVTFVTDDYVTITNNLSTLEVYRRKRIEKYLKKIINNSQVFYVISPMMKHYYDEKFLVNSKVILNMTEDLLLPNQSKKKLYETIVYAGGLHLNRNRTIMQLITYIVKLNDDYGMNLRLDIYSNNKIEESILKKLNAEKYVRNQGHINTMQLKQVLNKADYLLFVESFDEEMILSTKYSLSTKVPEYLSLMKPIIAIGPKEISSINYLEDCSFTLNSLNIDIDEFYSFFTDSQLQSELKQRARQKFLAFHIKENQKKLFNNEMYRLINEGEPFFEKE